MIDLTWKAGYETGHPRIDFEHRVFVDLIGSVEHAATHGASEDKLRRTAIEIYKYADFHFFSEESIMVEVGFPDLDRHRALHQSLLAELRDFVESVCVDSVRAEAMVEFLAHWFVSHTVHEDLKLARFAATKA